MQHTVDILLFLASIKRLQTHMQNKTMNRSNYKDIRAKHYHVASSPDSQPWRVLKTPYPACRGTISNHRKLADTEEERASFTPPVRHNAM